MKPEDLMAAMLRGEAHPVSVRWEHRGKKHIKMCWLAKNSRHALYLPKDVKLYSTLFHPSGDWHDWSGDVTWHHGRTIGWVPENADRSTATLNARLYVRHSRTYKVSYRRLKYE